MNSYLLIAAVLAFVIGALHSLLGERYVMRRVITDSMPPLAGSPIFMRRTVWFAWHLTTLLFWGFAAMLLNMSVGTGALFTARAIVAWTFVACAILSVVVTRARHFSWFVFAAIAVCTFISGSTT